jgi:hypothetical protein
VTSPTLSDLIRADIAAHPERLARVDAANRIAALPLDAVVKPTVVNPETGEWEYRPAPASDMPWLARRAILATNSETGK